MDIVVNYVMPIFGGVTLAGIISTIIYACIKAGFSKLLSKINTEKIVENATNKSVAKIKDVTLKHNIQPLVVSELKKITETAHAYIKDELAEVKTQYSNIINILQKLSAYFDNSIGVSEEAKAELKQAIESAKTTGTIEEAIIESQVIVEEKPEKKETKKTSENTQTIQGDR